MEALLAEADCDHLVFYGANRAGSAVQWLTQWPVTTEAVGVFSPGKRDALFVQYVNHPPLARKLADKAEIVEWGGESSIRKAIAVLEKRGARENRVGVIGPMNVDAHAALAARFGKVDEPQPRLREAAPREVGRRARLVPPRRLASATAAWRAARRRSGRGERARTRRRRSSAAMSALGGTTGIHFIGTTPMRDPQVAAPSQFPFARRVPAGDIVFAEITAAFWDHSGQVLRSFTVGEEPTPLYRDLHAAADAAFDAIVAVLRRARRRRR